MAPPGYEKVDSHSPVDLKNKQVYLAQVPSDFDPRKAEFRSETEIVYNGTTYFVNSSASIADCDILCSSADGKLIPSSSKLAGLLALTKKVALPKIDYDTVIEKKPNVPQQENLRMRHFPSGYGPKSFGVDESTSKSAGTRRKHSETSSKTGSEETPRKKHKKEKSEDSSEKKKKKKSHKQKSSKSED